MPTVALKAIPAALNVLVIDDEHNIRRTLTIYLEAAGHRVVAVSDVDAAYQRSRTETFDLVFLDVRLGSGSGLEALPSLIASNPWLSVIVMTAHGTIESAVEAMRLGAVEYLTKPFQPRQLDAAILQVTRVRALEQRIAALEPTDGRDPDPRVLLEETSSPAMRQAIRMATQSATSDASVLICGESGTGKGVLASLIHRLSGRAAGPLVTVAAPSLTASLAESELFGHARGAFTGAVRDYAGKVAAADRGTLFLDEIGDLQLELQPKLLRFLQDRTYERVGDSITRRGDVRFVFATNVDLDAAVRSGRFRQDLLYRINVLQIDVPPLRERPDDILTIAEQLLATLRGDKPIHAFTDAARDALRGYRWPGNVRELRNVIERAVLLCKDRTIGVEHLAKSVLPLDKSGAPSPIRLGDPIPLDRINAEHLRLLLQQGRSLEDVAETLQMDVTTLWRKRRQYGI